MSATWIRILYVSIRTEKESNVYFGSTTSLNRDILYSAISDELLFRRCCSRVNYCTRYTGDEALFYSIYITGH